MHTPRFPAQTDEVAIPVAVVVFGAWVGIISIFQPAALLKVIILRESQSVVPGPMASLRSLAEMQSPAQPRLKNQKVRDSCPEIYVLTRSPEDLDVC